MQRSYPEIFFKLRKTITCDLLKPKRLKKFDRLKIWPVFKGIDREIINFQEQKYFPARDFDKSLQIVRCSCTATKGHQMRKLKFHSL